MGERVWVGLLGRLSMDCARREPWSWEAVDLSGCCGFAGEASSSSARGCVDALSFAMSSSDIHAICSSRFLSSEL